MKVKEMGNVNKIFKLTKIKKDCNKISEIKCKDFEIIKTIWQIIEKDTVYYGFATCTILFRNHPQYAKYFEDEMIPEFVREAKVKKKFTVIYDIISTLFVNYQDKPIQRNYLLGYIAMVHKDMGLTLQDFENFISSILETLCIELPTVMTNEYVLIQMKYFNILVETILALMNQQKAKLDEVTRSNDRTNRVRILERYNIENS
ncbi:uncharacterized protein LOC143175152 [Nomia melanderi]|uniref:uncharacterized protein LOC143175152 n=1 Tax=Nomia melanderi TaxID=2448451 RepID=UPI003FCD339E